eukprot:gene8314-9763_t
MAHLASRALHRSQSSVSYTVARMQDQLGVPLLRIDGRKAVLTEAGEVLLRRSRQLVKNASQLEDLAHHMEQGWEAEVRLVVDAAYPNARLVRALTAFMPQSRGCRVRLREEVLSGVEELLMDGMADLAISGFIIPGYLGTEMSDVEFVAVAHPEHPLHQLHRELSFQDLESHMQVVIRDSGRQQPRDVGWLGAEQRWTVGSLPTAATFVSSGLGFAWLPRHLIERELKEGLLKLLPLERGGSRNPTFYLYSNKDKPLGPATQILVELLRTFDTPEQGVPVAYFEHEGCTLHYEEYGHGAPLILIHGLGSSCLDWELQVPVLSQHYRLVVVDVRGHGRSDKPRERYSIAGFTADLVALIEHLHLPPAHVVGLSMGGMIAFQLAVDEPQMLKSLCIVNSAPQVKVRSASDYWQWAKRWSLARILSLNTIGKALGSLLFPKPEQAELRRKMAERWAKNDKRAYLTSFDAIVGWGVQEQLSKISCPTLVISADHDYTPVAQKEIYVKLLPDARLVVIEDSRHATPLDQPERFNNTLLDFLKTVETTTQDH